MRLIIVTQGVSRIVSPLIHSEHSVVGIVESAPRVTQGRLRSICRFLAVLAMGRNLRLYAWLKRIPYYRFAKGGEAGLSQWVADLSPDIMVVSSMSQLLRESVYSLPKLGTINLHTSLLPKYRGPNPAFWAYYHSDLEAGVTVHFIDRTEDTGDIIRQEAFALELGAPLADFHRITGELGVKAVLGALEDLKSGSCITVKQPSQSPTARARRITASEQLIDWGWPIERIWHLLRGGWLLGSIRGVSWAKHLMRLEVMDYERADMHGFRPGHLYEGTQGTHYVACCEGRIFVRFSWSITYLIRKIVL